jgi:ankyrin repeat protein
LGDPPITDSCQDIHKDHRKYVDMDVFWSRRLEIVRLLIEHNANVNAVNAAGDSPLMFASHLGQLEIVKLLLDHQANINALNINNRSALWFACNLARVEVVRELLARNAAVDLGDPIIVCCQDIHEDDRKNVEMDGFWSRRLEIVRLLILHDANVNVVDANGFTPLDYAQAYEQEEIVMAIKQALNIDEDEDGDENDFDEEDDEDEDDVDEIHI